MSYIVSATIMLVVLLSLIAIFGEAREAIKTGKRRLRKAEKEKLITQAIGMKGHLHKLDANSFLKLVVHIYEEIGYKTKLLPLGKEDALLLEQRGGYTLMVYKNSSWPISREALETF